MYYSAYVEVELRKTDQPFELVAYLEPPRPRRSCFGQDQAITLASRGLALAIERPDRFALAMLVGDLSRTRAGAPRLSRPMRGHPLRRRQRRPVSFADGPRRVQLIIRAPRQRLFLAGGLRSAGAPDKSGRLRPQEQQSSLRGVGHGALNILGNLELRL